MIVPTHADAYQVLLLQAADGGRGPVLFGESAARARKLVLPFLIGEKFPNVYLEHPLIGEPFIDVTLLYSQLDPGMRVESPAAGEHGALFDWFATVCQDDRNICIGFELDTKEEVLPEAAVHFQPRAHTELVRPFCEVVGEPARADLYLGFAERMPDGWPLSFFGMFRGRPASPLRICGYMDSDEKTACIEDRAHLSAAFDAIGFSAYDDAMLSQVSAVMAAAPGSVDFQFDVYPDGSLGPVFAIDAQFGIEQPDAVRETFENGPGATFMGMLEYWGAADNRWWPAICSAFDRAIPVELDGGGRGRIAFTIMPQWVKERWANGALQPSKLYHLAQATVFNDEEGKGEAAAES